ncbi:MAG: hypothetical protein QOJ94_1614 [Sphingomonadales bacterium]|jgi:hypothetical protein|nr:hypothetical protein [Sphingomonadales bacterium]
MSDTRPSGGEVDGAAELLASARARLSAAAADLALPRRLRLSERDRATVSALFAATVRSLEDDLRAAILPRLGGDALAASLGSAGLAIALPALEALGPAAVPGLLPLLLERTEEHRLVAAEPPLLAELAGDEDEAVAAEAMRLLILQAGRLDAFQEPLVGRDDLSAEILHALAWTAAAALRAYVVEHHGADPAAADAALTDAVALLLAGHDEGAGAAACSRRLVSRLAAAGRLDDRMMVRTLTEGTLPLFLAAAAARAGLDRAAAWEMLDEPSGRGAALLLGAAGLSRDAAATVLLRLAPSEARVAPQLDLFDALGQDEARRRLTPWRADPAYRVAIAELRA